MVSTDDERRYIQRITTMADEQYYRQMKEAAAFLQSGDGENASVILRRLHELHPDDVDIAVNLGGAYILSKQYKLAIPVLEAATTLDENNAAIWNNLAAAYLGTLPISTPEQQTNAISAYQRVLALDPYYPNAHYNLGLIYEDRQDWENAREMFAWALRVDPNDRDARMLLDKAERLCAQSD